MEEPKKTQSLSIFLIKSDVANADIFKETLLSETVRFNNQEIGTFYYKGSVPIKPTWYTNLFEETLDEAIASKIFNSSTKAILLIEKSGRRYVIAFGHGRHMLNESAYENDFGLKVVLNTVPEDSLRSIDITTLDGTAKHSKEQFARDSEISEFGINVERDLLLGVTGKIENSDLGTTMSGRDSLHVSIKADLSDLKSLLERYYQKSRESHYKQRYPWIDRIKAITDPSKIEALNGKLSESLSATDGSGEKLWMAVPEIINWHEYSGFRFGTSKSSPLCDDIMLGTFKNSLRDPERISDIEYLKKSARVYAIAAENDAPRVSWPAWKCIYYETSSDNETFILTAGEWYEVKSDFTEEIENFYQQVPTTDLELPEYDTTEFKGRGIDKGEFGYNKKVSSEDSNLVCLDRDLVSVGSSGSRIEFCDLYRNDKKIIHVKRYGGSSSLSHLFNQGLVSGETFLGNRKFVSDVNDKLPTSHKISNPEQRQVPGNYEIVFAVISSVSSSLDLPFFSKVSLRNAYTRLVEVQGFNVSLMKIQATRES